MHDATLKRLKELKFDGLPAEILGEVREVVHMLPARAKDSQIPVGASKFGGAPDLPADLAWPVNAKTGKPLAFFCQINFAEVHPCDMEGRLPASGWLYFFINSDVSQFDDDDTQMWNVLFHGKSGAEVSRRATPADLSKKAGDDADVCINTCRIEFARDIQFGNDFEDYYNELLAASIEDEESEEAREATAILKTMEKWKVIRNGKPKKACVDTSRPANEPAHQLLGHTHFSGCEEPSGYRLLLKIDADPKHLGMEFCDAGTWFIYVPERDLAKGDLSKVKVHLQIA